MFVASSMIGLSVAKPQRVPAKSCRDSERSRKTAQQNFSNYSSIQSGCNFLGPLIAGFTIDHAGHSLTCLYLALFTLLPVAMLAIRGSEIHKGYLHVATRSQGGIRAMLSEPGVRRVLATSSLLNTGTDLYQFYMPVYTHAIGMSASAIGIVLAMNSAAAFVVRAILPRLLAMYREEQLLGYAFYVGAASLILVPFSRAPSRWH